MRTALSVRTRQQARGARWVLQEPDRTGCPVSIHSLRLRRGTLASPLGRDGDPERGARASTAGRTALASGCGPQLSGWERLVAPRRSGQRPHGRAWRVEGTARLSTVSETNLSSSPLGPPGGPSFARNEPDSFFVGTPLHNSLGNNPAPFKKTYSCVSLWPRQSSPASSPASLGLPRPDEVLLLPPAEQVWRREQGGYKRVGRVERDAAAGSVGPGAVDVERARHESGRWGSRAGADEARYGSSGKRKERATG